MPLLQKGIAMAAGRMPKVIKPQAHAVIDYMVAGTFFLVGALYWRRNKRAAVSSLICGGATAANSLLTDYPGGAWKVMSFQTHGKLDAGLAGMTAMMPQLMGFKDDSESKFFTMQSMAETAVTAMTDFDYYEHPASDRLRHREEEGAA
jgi:hypothetical protein